MEMTAINIKELDALSLEYKRDYGTAFRNLNVSNLMNNPNAFGVISVFGPGFSEKITDLPFVKPLSLLDIWATMYYN